MSVLWPLQEALVERWKADAGVTDLVGQRIYDGMAPADAAFPYVRVGSKTEVDAGTFGVSGSTNTITVDVFSRPMETLEVDTDSEALAVYAALNASALTAPLTVDGYEDVDLRVDFVTTLVEDNGNTRHVPIRYRFSALETT